MADYGLKVSQPGYNVLTCTDKQLVYSSKFATFRVFAFGSGSITIPNPVATSTVTITHNLGYRPAFAVYSQAVLFPGDGAVTSEYYLTMFLDSIFGDPSITPYVTTTQLKIRYGVDHGPVGSVIAYRYFIYYNQAI